MALVDDFRRQAEEALKPSLDLGLNRLSLDEQGLGQEETNIGRTYDRTVRDLEEAAKNQQGSFEERQNQLGLLQSGLTSAGLGKIQTDLFRGKQESAQDKASRLADLALQRSGLGIQRQQLQQTYLSSVGDMVQKLLDQDTAKRAAASSGLGSKSLSALFNKPKPVAAPTPTRSPLNGLEPGIANLATRISSRFTNPDTNIEAQSLVGELATAFAQGQSVQNTEAILQSLYEDYQGIFTPDEINYIVFEARKPFENRSLATNLRF